MPASLCSVSHRVSGCNRGAYLAPHLDNELLAAAWQPADLSTFPAFPIALLPSLFTPGLPEAVAAREVQVDGLIRLQLA